MVDFQAAVDLDVPAGVGADFAVGDFFGEAVGEGHVAVGEGFLDFIELLFGVRLLGGILGCGDEADVLDGAGLDGEFAELQEVADLVIAADVGVLDHQLLGS